MERVIIVRRDVEADARQRHRHGDVETRRNPDDIRAGQIVAAALQYVRKVAGMRAPSSVNQPAFDQAVAQIAAATSTLLDGLTIRTARAS